MPFINEKIKDGFGKYIYENKDYYVGEWKDYLRNGIGTLYNKYGKIIYAGEWKNNLKNGQGKLYYKNGKIKYEGNWVDDKKDGEGKFYDENWKIIYDGIWKNDSIYKEKKSDYDNSSKIKNSEPGIQVSFQPAPQPTSQVIYMLAPQPTPQIIYLPTAQQNYVYNVYNGMMFNGNVLFVNK